MVTHKNRSSVAKRPVRHTKLKSLYAPKVLSSAVGCLAAVLILVVALLHQNGAGAACTPLPSAMGTVTNTFTVNGSGVYRIWLRLKTPDSTKNSVLVQVDNSLCNVTVGGNSLPANTWTWVSYTGGSTSSTLTTTLAAGSHTIEVAGNADGIEVDRIILSQDLTTVPTGTGDNLANPPDTTPPIVTITSPAPNATVTPGSSVSVTASDASALSKVELYVDNTLAGTDTSMPYSFTLSSTLSGGSHVLTAKAYDAAGNQGSSSAVTVTVKTTSGTAYSPEDFNHDGKVDLQDFSYLANDFGKPVSQAKYSGEDINRNGSIDLSDFSSLSAAMQKIGP